MFILLRLMWKLNEITIKLSADFLYIYIERETHMCSDNLTLKLGCKEPKIAKSDVKRSKLEDLVLLATD